MNTLFERLSLQGHIKRIIDEYGPEQGWAIVEAAVAREAKWRVFEHERKYTNGNHTHRDTALDRETGT